MKNDCFNTFEKSDFNLNREDMDISHDNRFLTAYIETWFDVDKKFGLNTKEYDVWVSLFCNYDPFGDTIHVFYSIEADNYYIERTYETTEDEKQIFKNLMEETCIKNEKMSARDFLLQFYLECEDRVQLTCEKYQNGYRIRNIIDNFVLWTEDKTEELKNHTGHKIEATIYNEDGCYCLECKDCCTVLHRVECKEVDILLEEAGIKNDTAEKGIELG